MMQFRNIQRTTGSISQEINYLSLIFTNTLKIQTLSLISSNTPIPKWWYVMCYSVTGCRCNSFDLFGHRCKTQIVFLLDLWT